MNESVNIFQSVAILIDGNNMEKSLHSLVKDTNAMLDMDKVIPRLLQNRGLSRLIYFREGKNISSKLADRLHQNYHGSVVPCHKSADIPLSIKATQIAQKVDTIIIMSGDSDYVDLVTHLKSEGVRVEIAGVNANTAQILIDEADYYNEITKDDCFVYSKPPERKKTTKPKTRKKSKVTPEPKSKTKSTRKPRKKPKK
ncbi:MAG: NYN domain-containing protein [Bacteroidia bacterium]|nr:NYN domain-containing protein [Bacteroidia bacterium]